VREHRNFDVEQRRPDRPADQSRIALIIGVGDQRDARRQ
jgi:hypothetical protein